MPLNARTEFEAASMLRDGRADAMGADRGLLEVIAEHVPGAAVLPGSYLTVDVVVALPFGRSPAACSEIVSLIAQAKDGGAVERGFVPAQLTRGFGVEVAGARTGTRCAQDAHPGLRKEHWSNPRAIRIVSSLSRRI